MIHVRLSKEQNHVVEHLAGAMLVIAGPGSGKTRVLTERIRRLLKVVPGHFHVLALTYSNKAANEMKERLLDLGDERRRAFIGNFHSFCLNILTERGKLVGVTGLPHIFEQTKDRKELLLTAVKHDAFLLNELNSAGDAKARSKRADDWLQAISWFKTHPITCEMPGDSLERRIIDTYDAGLRACDAYDFDDLLLLAYQLLNSYPKIADFYRRLYKFICIDEAQDLNEAQYAVLTALCGENYKNVLMVGDPKQSIYGFNTSSPEYMWSFREEFGAVKVELMENFRSSSSVVQVARSLEPTYLVEAQLPILGAVSVLIGTNEPDEADKVANEIQLLIAQGHADIEGGIGPSNCAILGRTRFVLIEIERELKARGISYYKRLSANHENESIAVDEFQLALRILANPKDRFHLTALAKKWKQPELIGAGPGNVQEVCSILSKMAELVDGGRANAVAASISAVAQQTQRLDLMPGIRSLQAYADSLPEEEKLVIYEDLAVLQTEWDQYLRSNDAAHTIAGFMSKRALGGTQVSREGIALLTVHSSKGLEFDVVFIAGMADGVFPVYRARGKIKETAEEARSVFVAVTRSKRLLYFSYPQKRMMPWGDEKWQQPSPYLKFAGLIS